MRIVFFGSSWFSIYALKACLETPNHLCMVITTPDQKKGRGLELTPTPVKQFALDHKIPVIAPENLKSPEILQQISDLKPDLFVVFSYGKMIPSAWLKVPFQVCLNVHPSLLPKYRGASPIQWPLLNGDGETGLSIAEVTPKLDAGDIFFQSRIQIPKDIDAHQMTELLASHVPGALSQVFADIRNQNLKRTTQNESLSCYARKLAKEDGKIDWTKNAAEIHNLIRGLNPWPTAYTVCQQNQLQILKSNVQDLELPSAKPGSLISLNKNGGFQVQAGKGSLIILRVKPAGKKEMSGIDFVNGARLSIGSVLGSQ